MAINNSRINGADAVGMICFLVIGPLAWLITGNWAWFLIIALAGIAAGVIWGTDPKKPPPTL